MKVRMLTGMGGTTFSHAPGDEVEVSETVGQAWVEARIAAAVGGEVKAKTFDALSAAERANLSAKPPAAYRKPKRKG
jgi:hypothetical protein